MLAIHLFIYITIRIGYAYATENEIKLKSQPWNDYKFTGTITTVLNRKCIVQISKILR